MSAGMTRDQLTAHFTLHDWTPASTMSNKGPMKETGLMHPTMGFLRVARGKHFAHISRRGGMSLETMHRNRESRGWAQITLPRLRLMYARLELLLNSADDVKETSRAP